MSALLVKPSGRTSEVVSVTQERAGWQTISLRLLRLEKGQKQLVSQPGEELAFVMLAGQVTIGTGEQKWERLGERASVFAGMPHTLYLPVGTERVEIEALAAPCEVAVCGARANRKFPPAVIEPSSVEVEIRGGANATRQINHIIKPDFPADRLLVVEVYTPSGNWSSYPPHKHDVHDPPGEVDLDEIYFYKISQPEGFAIQRVYTKDGRRNETLTVRDNEVVLIPEGYHPVMAASDDPDYAWVRGTWTAKDPRLPLVS